jgi:RNA polymerase sigma-70 factor, ECF subfamily
MLTDPPLDITTLLEAAKQGNLAVLNPLCEASRPLLIEVARNAVPRDCRRLVHDSDMVQDALLAAMERIGKFRGETKEQLLSWMVTILHHVVITAIRRLRTAKRSLDRQQPLEKGRRMVDVVDPRAKDPVELASRQEEFLWLSSVIKRLSQTDQDVLVLWGKCRNTAEVATCLGTTPTAAYKRLTRALESLVEKAGAYRSSDETSAGPAPAG